MYGEGIENYMNDAPVDVAVELNPGGGPRRPIKGEALPLTGVVAFLDHSWSERWSSSAGYSWLDIDNTTGQAPSAFRQGHYALANLLYYPVKDVMMGGEFQYGRRENFSDGFTSDDMRIQFSFRYNFLFSVGGQC